MTNPNLPTDPGVEAATLALLETANYEISISAESLRAHLASEHCGDCTKASCPCMRCICEEAQKEAAYILKAADEGAWQPIESVPVEETIDIWVQHKDGSYREPEVMLSEDRKRWVINLDEWDVREINATHWRPRPTPPPL